MPSVFSFLTGWISPVETPTPTDQRNTNGHPPTSANHVAPRGTNEATQTVREMPSAPPVRSTHRRRPRKVDRKTLVEHITDEDYCNFDEDYARGREVSKFKFGSIAYATSKISQERVLCKTFLKKELIMSEDVEIVKSEIYVSNALKGEPIVAQLITTYEDAEHVHLVKELCTGEELLDVVLNHKTYSEQQAAGIFASIVKIVELCHSKDVRLRSLKLESFRYNSKKDNAVLKLVDLSNAVIAEPGQKLKEIVGEASYMAPEMLHRRYGPEADLWSAGVILFILLLGTPPFSGEDNAEIFEKVIGGSIDVYSPEWLSLSKDARDLIINILKTRPHERLTSAKILEHPWINDGGSGETRELHQSVMSKLKTFAHSNKLKKVTLQIISQSLPKDQVRELKKMFRTIDSNGSGSITVTELRTGLKKCGIKMSEPHIEALLESVDVDGDGAINYKEFVSAMAHKENGYNASDLVRAFHHFDIDGNGYLTTHELATVLEDNYDLEPLEIQHLVNLADKDKDGKIDFEEFAAMMQQDD